MHIAVFSTGNMDGTYTVDVLPEHEFNPEHRARDALHYVNDHAIDMKPGFRGIFLKIGGQL